MKKINIVIYGATGTIGSSVLSIINQKKKDFNVEGITCHTNLKKLIKIAENFNVKKIGYEDKLVSSKKINTNKYISFKDLNEFDKIVSSKTDIIIFAISGLAALSLLVKCIKKGKKIGLANKECIISFGKKIIFFAKKYSSQIIPLDSEHNAVYHLLNSNYGTFKSITITASGGPFLNLSQKKFKDIKINEALKHPVWKMGKKISIDSATMMNKALEIMEARYLFNLEKEQINAIIHPQSIIHAMINYDNQITIAMLNEPDMRIPISTLFYKFDKQTHVRKKLNLIKTSKLEFHEIDKYKFPAIKLGEQIMDTGGLAPHLFNYLNEVLVNNFLRGKIKFIDIVELNLLNIDNFFKKNRNVSNPTIDDIFDVNTWLDRNIILKESK